MRIFLSYASDDRPIAEKIVVRLENEDHEVFFDRQDLRSGTGYDQKIRDEIKASDLLIFLLSPDSVMDGRYTLTELKFARKKWSNLNGRVLPVMARETDFKSIPAALSALHILTAEGNLVAEVVAEVAGMAARQDDSSPGLAGNRKIIAAVGALVVLVAGLAGYNYFRPPEPGQTTITSHDPTPGTTGTGAAPTAEQPVVEEPIVEQPIAVVDECEDQSELGDCDLELAWKICTDQRNTAAIIDAGAGDSIREPVVGRDKVYLFGAVNSGDDQDTGQLNTLMQNVKNSLATDDLDSAPPLRSANGFLDGPVRLRTEYDSSQDALLILNTQLNPAFEEGDVRKRGGDSAIYFGEGPPLSVKFTLPENRFDKPYSLHRAAIAYSRAQLAPTHENKLELLNSAREFVNGACKKSAGGGS